MRTERGKQAARLSERFPRNGALIAYAGSAPEQSLLELVLHDAERAIGKPLLNVSPILRGGVLLVDTDAGFLRLAIGSANRQVHTQASILDGLHARNLSREWSVVLPRILATGTSGLGDWSLETKLPGKPSEHFLSPQVLTDAVSFLIDLAGPPTGDADPWLTTARAEFVASLLGGTEATAVLRIAEVTADRLREIPRVFGHGDFCSNNLLVQDGRLSGVIDWEGAGPGRLPLLDLYHLLALQNCQPNTYEWGAAVVSYLVPLGQSGDDPQLRRYLSAVGLGLTAKTLQDLVCAYWLSRITYQLSTFAMRRIDRTWIRRNVTVPANALLVTL